MFVFTILFIASGITTSLGDVQKKIQEATTIAFQVYHHYYELFVGCLQTSMPHQRFVSDNLHSYINAFSKTTVGFAPQFTSNRKFFANMISTPAFKAMLDKDINELHKNILEKIKFCDQSVINQDILKQFYDREVDQTKL